MISSRYTSFYSILNPIPSSLLRENIEKLSQKLHFKAQMLINQNISNLGDEAQKQYRKTEEIHEEDLIYSPQKYLLIVYC